MADIVKQVQADLVDGAKNGVHLKMNGEKLDGDWLYIAVVPSKPGVRTSEYANFMSEIERKLRAAGKDNVLLVPVLED